MPKFRAVNAQSHRDRYEVKGLTVASLMPTRAAMSDELRAAVRYVNIEVSLIDFARESSVAAVREVGNMPIR
jgi:hypothetical protein